MALSISANRSESIPCFSGEEIAHPSTVTSSMVSGNAVGVFVVDVQLVIRNKRMKKKEIREQVDFLMVGSLYTKLMTVYINITSFLIMKFARGGE
jgi:hypothetical protein